MLKDLNNALSSTVEGAGNVLSSVAQGVGKALSSPMVQNMRENMAAAYYGPVLEEKQRLKQGELRTEQIDLQNQQTQQEITAQKLRQAQQTLLLIQSAVSAADMLGMPRGSTEHTAAMKSMLQQSGASPEMLQMIDKLKLAPVTPNKLITVAPGASVYNPQTGTMTQAPDRRRDAYKQFFNKEGQSQWFDLSKEQPDLNIWSAEDPLKHELTGAKIQTEQARRETVLSTQEANTKRAELALAQTELTKAKTETERTTLQGKVDKLQSEVSKNEAQTGAALSQANAGPSLQEAAQTLGTLHKLQDDNIDAKTKKPKDLNVAAALAGQIDDVSKYYLAKVKEKYGNVAAAIAGDATKGTQDRSQAKAGGTAVVDMGGDKGTAPKSFKDLGITAPDDIVQFALLQRIGGTDYNVQALMENYPDDVRLLLQAMKQGVPDPQTPGRYRKLTNQEIKAILAQIGGQQQ
jgi:hypothetical protein